MNSLTEKLKSEIKIQYKSIRRFSKAIGEPPTTVVSSLDKGVENSKFALVKKMCMALGVNAFDDFSPSEKRK